MKSKVFNLVLTGALCISVSAFAIDGKKTKPHHPVKPSHPQKFIDPANMDDLHYICPAMIFMITPTAPG